MIYCDTLQEIFKDFHCSGCQTLNVPHQQSDGDTSSNNMNSFYLSINSIKMQHELNVNHYRYVKHRKYPDEPNLYLWLISELAGWKFKFMKKIVLKFTSYNLKIHIGCFFIFWTICSTKLFWNGCGIGACVACSVLVVNKFIQVSNKQFESQID